MVVGVASDVRPNFGSRRGSYLVFGALASLAEYRTRPAYLAATLVITIGDMIASPEASRRACWRRSWARVACSPPRWSCLSSSSRASCSFHGAATRRRGRHRRQRARSAVDARGWSCWSVSATRSVSAALLSLLLVRIGVTRAVVVAAVMVFIFRATPDVGQGYSYWAIDRLAFDERFLGLACSTACTNGSASPPEAWR
jgi:hypothetical protein